MCIQFLNYIVNFFLRNLTSQTVDEIGEANQRHNEFHEKTPEMLETFRRADAKNKILSAWTKEHVEQVGREGAVLEQRSLP